MKKYPDLESFVKLKLNYIGELIKSLGLLFRANIIQEMALQIKDDFKKRIPDNANDLKKLKGIGDYSANAILCFGFNKRKPLLDSNFIRIYQRMFNVTSKTKTPKTDKDLWKFSENLLPNENYVNFNYAILDLGGIICLSRNPKCENCPVKDLCYYFESVY